MRVLLLLVLVPSLGLAGEQERIRVSDDGKGFVLAESGKPFVPWGFNYDHDEQGRLIEDYWETEWPKVEEDFGEMKGLGANVVRIHLQLGRFLESADKPNEAALARLERLVQLAEKQGLRLDLTGLGCYHKKDVPEWYDRLDEAGRWNAQARFWEAVAGRCAKSSAIFCYDLMNEPVVPAGKRKDGDWLGPAFGGKHFVQVVSLDQGDRPRPEIARKWIQHLVAAIRRHDRQHLVTVGLVDWSLDRPGLTSGFVPAKIAADLDFLAVHLYPEKAKLDDALATLKGFSAGKPVVIEETFPLKCSAEELGTWIEESKGTASGWIGFYWGRTPEECRKSGTLPDAIMASWLEMFEKRAKRLAAEAAPSGAAPSGAARATRFREVDCEGTYPHHLQGVCTDDKDSIFWSFTTELVKTGVDGRVANKVPVANHHGDLCFHDGRVFVAVNLGKFNDPKGNADSWVYVYDAETLKLLARHEVQDVTYGAGGIGVRNGRFFVVGGLPDGVEENFVYEYDDRFRLQKKHTLKSGHTHLGIQTATFAGDRWWFGCYGSPATLLAADAVFEMKGRFEFDCSMGLVGLPDGRFLSATSRSENDRWTGRLRIAASDKKSGLRLVAPAKAPAPSRP